MRKRDGATFVNFSPQAGDFIDFYNTWVLLTVIQEVSRTSYGVPSSQLPYFLSAKKKPGWNSCVLRNVHLKNAFIHILDGKAGTTFNSISLNKIRERHVFPVDTHHVRLVRVR